SAFLGVVEAKGQFSEVVGGHELLPFGRRDTPPGLKPRGFSGKPSQCRAWRPKALSEPAPKDVDRGVVVPIERDAAIARDPAIREAKVIEDDATSRAGLGRPGGI